LSRYVHRIRGAGRVSGQSAGHLVESWLGDDNEQGQCRGVRQSLTTCASRKPQRVSTKCRPRTASIYRAPKVPVILIAASVPTTNLLYLSLGRRPRTIQHRIVASKGGTDTASSSVATDEIAILPKRWSASRQGRRYQYAACWPWHERMDTTSTQSGSSPASPRVILAALCCLTPAQARPLMTQVMEALCGHSELGHRAGLPSPSNAKHEWVIDQPCHPSRYLTSDVSCIRSGPYRRLTSTAQPDP
jgi:hypothetical protein